MKRTKDPERNQRLLTFLNSLKISRKAFSAKIGTTYHNLSLLLSGHGNISEAMAYKIGKAYSDLNLEWLMSGRGEMLLTVYEIEERVAAEAPQLSPGQPEKIVLEDLPGILRRLSNFQTALENRVTDLQDRVKALEDATGQGCDKMPVQSTENKEGI